ncbi:T9SS type A sorting domain-containing protein [bacterium]|nr:T9SS type A sorting domain-containing protein [bacterium]
MKLSKKIQILIIHGLLFNILNATPPPVFTNLPSTSAQPEGLRIRINPPVQQRYTDGAPIVLYMPGGFQGEGLDERETGLTEQGFIEIRFNLPGNGENRDLSGGGPYDYRGVSSLIALRDIIQFANGSITDINGNTLSDLVSPASPQSDNVGLIGWSMGGSTNICVAGRWGHVFQLAWIVNWESPVGDGMPQAECGAKLEGILRPNTMELNPAYDPANGSWDLSTLAYDPQIQIPILENTREHVTGGLFFDMNQDAQMDMSIDYIPYPLVFEMSDGLKAYYSERLREKANQETLFPATLPPHIPTPAENRQFWAIRNGAYWIDSTIIKLPGLMFIIVANDTDHVQRAPDHPHVVLQYEGFVNAGCRFVRLNPDRSYVESLLGHENPRAADNPAFMTLDRTDMKSVVEPVDANNRDDIGYSLTAAAAACELADRTQFSDLRDQIHELITCAEELNPPIPKAINLMNYPNPFNSQTTILFELTEPDEITMDIINLKGQTVERIIQTRMPEGKHKLSWEASKYPTGLYICRIIKENQLQSRKLIYIR